MVNSETLKYNIINAVMRMDNELYLSEIQDFINKKNISDDTSNNDVEGANIKTINVEHGVSLEEIEKRQTVNKITFEEIESMFEEEEWKQTLGELLESID